MTLKDKFLFSLRKIAISLKRNYYIVPLLFVFAVCVHFMCELYVLSPAFDRISSKLMSSLIAFAITLLTTLACVAYLNYALVKYGQKRPILMLIVYYVLWAIVFGLTITLFINNLSNLNSEIANLATLEEGSAAYQKTYSYILYEYRAYRILIVNIVLQSVTLLLVITAPFIQSALKKITFKRLDTYE